MPKTLLLADDSVTIQKVVGISFANEDVALVTVDNGDDAVAKAREVRPDIVLADVVMPGRDGYQVCEAVKADPNLAGVPVLLLTGTFEAFDEARAAQVGADGHITKPFEAQALVDQVNAHLARAASAAAAAAAPAPAAVTTPQPALPQAPAQTAEAGSYEFFDQEASTPPAASPPAFSFDGETSPGTPAPPALGSPDETMVMPAGTSLDGIEAPMAAEEPLLEAFEEVADGETALGELEPELAGEPVIDPAAGRDYDVSSSDLGDSFSSLAAPTEAPTLPGAGQPGTTPVTVHAPPAGASPGETQLVMPPPPAPVLGAAPELASPPPIPVGEPFAAPEPIAAPEPTPHPQPIAAAEPVPGPEPIAAPAPTPLPEPIAAAETTPAPEPIAAATPAPAPAYAPEPIPAPHPMAGTSAEADPAELSSEAREQIREAIEKVAWEAFGRATEGIVRQAVERIEKVAWEVVPQMAETLIREEIRRMKGDKD